MGAITCRKCGLTVKADSPPPIACPGCGAIYAKVEAAARDSGWLAASTASRSSAAAPASPFITELRAGTHYPAFRSTSRIIALLTYAIAVVVAGAAVVEGFRHADIVAAAVGVLIGLVTYLVGRTGMEAAEMLADLSDAAIYTAERQRE